MPAAAVYQTTTPVTQAASPVTSGWQNVGWASQVIANWTVTGGTNAVSAQWSFDGANVSAIADTVLTSGTAVKVLAPYVRIKIAVTVSDQTALAMFVQGTS